MKVINFTLWLWAPLLLSQLAHCAKKSRLDGTFQRNIPDQEKKESETEEDSSSGVDMVGMHGLTGAGIFSSQQLDSSSPKCLGQDIRMEKLTQVTAFCEKEEMENNNNENGTVMTDMPMPGKNLCFTACLYKYMGLIGDDLMFTSGISTVVVDIFPPIAHIQAKRAFRHCAKNTALPLSKADNCVSFGALKNCIMRNVQNICNGEYY